MLFTNYAYYFRYSRHARDWPLSVSTFSTNLLHHLLDLVLLFVMLIIQLVIQVYRQLFKRLYEIRVLVSSCTVRSYVSSKLCLWKKKTHDFLPLIRYYPGLWSRSRRLGLETYQRLVSVSSFNVSCPSLFLSTSSVYEYDNSMHAVIAVDFRR